MKGMRVADADLSDTPLDAVFQGAHVVFTR
jgi:hypothetical protein